MKYERIIIKAIEYMVFGNEEYENFVDMLDIYIKRDEILAKAKEDAEKRMENLELELANEKKSMEAEIRKEIVDVAFAAAEKIVAREINQDKYLDVVDEILKGAME